MLKTECAVESKWKVKKGKQWVAEEMEEVSRQGMQEVWYKWYVNSQGIFSREFRPLLTPPAPNLLPWNDQKYCSFSLDDPLVASCYYCGIQLWDNISRGKKKEKNHRSDTKPQSAEPVPNIPRHRATEVWSSGTNWFLGQTTQKVSLTIWSVISDSNLLRF